MSLQPMVDNVPRLVVDILLFQKYNIVKYDWKGLFGMNKRIVLGYYASLEDAQKELESISETSKQSTTYALKFAVKMCGVRIAAN